LGDLVAGQFEFEELDDPKPLPVRKIQLVEPSSCEYVKIMPASLTTKPFAAYTVKPFIMAFGAEDWANFLA